MIFECHWRKRNDKTEELGGEGGEGGWNFAIECQWCQEITWLDTLWLSICMLPLSVAVPLPTSVLRCHRSREVARNAAVCR